MPPQWNGFGNDYSVCMLRAAEASLGVGTNAKSFAEPQDNIEQVRFV